MMSDPGPQFRLAVGFSDDLKPPGAAGLVHK